MQIYGSHYLDTNYMLIDKNEKYKVPHGRDFIRPVFVDKKSVLYWLVLESSNLRHRDSVLSFSELEVCLEVVLISHHYGTIYCKYHLEFRG